MNAKRRLNCIDEGILASPRSHQHTKDVETFILAYQAVLVIAPRSALELEQPTDLGHSHMLSVRLDWSKATSNPRHFAAVIDAKVDEFVRDDRAEDAEDWWCSSFAIKVSVKVAGQDADLSTYTSIPFDLLAERYFNILIFPVLPTGLDLNFTVLASPGWASCLPSTRLVCTPAEGRSCRPSPGCVVLEDVCRSFSCTGSRFYAWEVLGRARRPIPLRVRQKSVRDAHLRE